jgi:hypothetical protein
MTATSRVNPDLQIQGRLMCIARPWYWDVASRVAGMQAPRKARLASTDSAEVDWADRLVCCPFDPIANEPISPEPNNAPRPSICVKIRRWRNRP